MGIKLKKPERGSGDGRFYFTSMRIPLKLAQQIEVRAIDAGISYSEFVRQAAQMLVDKIKAPKNVKPDKTKHASKGATAEYNERYKKGGKKKGKKLSKAEKKAAKKAKKLKEKKKHKKDREEEPEEDEIEEDEEDEDEDDDD